MDPCVFDRRVHRLVSQCGDLSRAARPVGKFSQALVLPALQKADPDVAEFAAAELAMAAWPLP